MKLLLLFLTSFGIAFSGAMMPGPLLTVTISESTKRGLKAGPLLIIGHALLELTLIILLIYGLGPMIKQKWTFITISVIGGCVLAWMAFDMFNNLSKLSLQAEIKDTTKNPLIWKGIYISLLNPYWSIWWATIGLGLIVHAQAFGYLGLAIFFTGHILGDFIWYGLISFAIDKGRHLLSDTWYRKLIGFCGGILIVISILFFISVIQKLT